MLAGRTPDFFKSFDLAPCADAVLEPGNGFFLCRSPQPNSSPADLPAPPRLAFLDCSLVLLRLRYGADPFAAAAWREFVDLGIDPSRDFARLRFAGTDPAPACAAVLDGVRQGTADAGVLPSQALWKLTLGQDAWYRVLPPPRPDPDAQGFPSLSARGSIPHRRLSKRPKRPSRWRPR